MSKLSEREVELRLVNINSLVNSFQAAYIIKHHSTETLDELETYFLEAEMFGRPTRDETRRDVGRSRERDILC